jgi:nucleotide-binding universal stress UspA family protein
MYKKMLVPLDGSQLAENVLPYAKKLAGRLDLEVIILHVCTPEERAFNAKHRDYIDQIAETMASQAIEVQQETALQKEAKRIKAKGELTIGYPAEEILRYADKHKVDFILIATHGYSGIKQWTISSVVDKVLRASKVPVLLVRTEIPYEIAYNKWPPKMLLVPLDGSELAESVFPHVETLAKQRGVEPMDVVLLMVYERPSIPSYLSEASQLYGWDELINQMTSSLKKANEQYLAGIEKRLRETGLKVTSRLLTGNPAHEIIEFTRQNPFSLVVIATHGRSGYVCCDYGDVTNKILHEGTSPIFLVRTAKPKIS